MDQNLKLDFFIHASELKLRLFEVFFHYGIIVMTSLAMQEIPSSSPG